MHLVRVTAEAGTENDDTSRYLENVRPHSLRKYLDYEPAVPTCPASIDNIHCNGAIPPKPPLYLPRRRNHGKPNVSRWISFNRFWNELYDSLTASRERKVRMVKKSELVEAFIV